MADATGGEFYQKCFDPKAYLEDYFKFGTRTIGDEYLTFTLPHLCTTFGPGGLKGNTLLDIGTGPTIYQLLSACESFKEITASDYTESNHRELEKWLKNEQGAFDWTPVIKFVCELEGNRVSITEKEEKLRKAVKKILKCDILKTNPLDPLVLPQFDCVLSSLCLEGACKTQEEVCAALKNITTLLKPGGHLVLCGDVGNSYYQVGEVMFSSMSLNEALLRKAVSGAGYVIEKMELTPRADTTAMKEIADYSGIFFIVAQHVSCSRNLE